jgi:hypothetical protein
MKELYEYVINFMSDNYIDRKAIYHGITGEKLREFMASCFDCIESDLGQV